MQLTYDPQVDVLLIRLREAPYAYGVEVRPGVILHFDASDELIAIELLDARSVLGEEPPEMLTFTEFAGPGTHR